MTDERLDELWNIVADADDSKELEVSLTVAELRVIVQAAVFARRLTQPNIDEPARQD